MCLIKSTHSLVTETDLFLWIMLVIKNKSPIKLVFSFLLPKWPKLERLAAHVLLPPYQTTSGFHGVFTAVVLIKV